MRLKSVHGVWNYLCLRLRLELDRAEDRQEGRKLGSNMARFHRHAAHLQGRFRDLEDKAGAHSPSQICCRSDEGQPAGEILQNLLQNSTTKSRMVSMPSRCACLDHLIPPQSQPERSPRRVSRLLPAGIKGS